MWSFHFRSFCNIIPKSVNLSTLSISWLSIFSWSEPENVLHLENTMYFVLVKLNVNLFAINQFFTLSSSLERTKERLSAWSSLYQATVSSAYNMKFNILDECIISLMYRLNIVGPRIDPWGAEYTTLQWSDELLPTVTKCFLSDK